MPPQVSSILSGEGFDVAVGASPRLILARPEIFAHCTEAAKKRATPGSAIKKAENDWPLLLAPTVVGRLLPLFAHIVLFARYPGKGLG